MKQILVDKCETCPFLKTTPTNDGWDYLTDVKCKKINRDIILKTDLRFDSTLKNIPEWCELNNTK